MESAGHDTWNTYSYTSNGNDYGPYYHQIGADGDVCTDQDEDYKPKFDSADECAKDMKEQEK